MMKYVSILLLLFYTNAWGEERLPSWAKDQDRKLINEDISHWGTGLGQTPELALFKAEFMAVRSISKECGGFASKGIYIPKKYVTKHQSKYVAYARANIPFPECDYNKTPMAKSNKELENSYLKKGLGLYDKLIKESFERKTDKPKQDTMKVVLDYLKIKNKEQDSRITAIEEQIRLMQVPSKTVQNITINKREIHLHGTEAKYQECMQEYDDIMYEAQQQSYKNKVPGNLVGKNSINTYNKAQRKLYKCNQMKRNGE
jgi:hypothetical protein